MVTGAEASEKHAELKIQCLIRATRLKEAVEYARFASEQRQFQKS